MKQWYMVIDVSRCHDCNTCFMSCKDEFYRNDWLPYSVSQPRHGQRWMNIERKERGQFPRIDVSYRPTPCMHCENAPCVDAGHGAVIRREDGIVYIDPVLAKGKIHIASSCPYGAIFWNEELQVAQKCTMCAHLIDDGWKTTRCAQSCPTGSIITHFIEPPEMAKMVKEEGLEVLLEELGTKPHVFYKNLYRFDKHFITGAVISNDDCVKGANAVLNDESGREIARQSTNCFGEFKFDALSKGTYTILLGSTYQAAVSIENSLNLGCINI